jgi:hypothetical protein
MPWLSKSFKTFIIIGYFAKVAGNLREKIFEGCWSIRAKNQIIRSWKNWAEVRIVERNGFESLKLFGRSMELEVRGAGNITLKMRIRNKESHKGRIVKIYRGIDGTANKAIYWVNTIQIRRSPWRKIRNLW